MNNTYPWSLKPFIAYPLLIMTRFKVVINSNVEIRREWDWSKILMVKERLKELGFRWNGEYWIGKVYSVSLIKELKALLELTNDEVEKLMKTITINASGGVIGVENLEGLEPISSDCVLREEGGLFIVSLSCLIREFVRNNRSYIGVVSSYEEYIDKAVENIRRLLAGKAVVGDLELSLKRAREFALANNKLRDLFTRRIEWWTVRLGLEKAELHFLSKELYDKLRNLTVPYYVADREGNLNKHDLRLIRKDDIVRSENKVLIRFPVFIRDTIKELLVKGGYRVIDESWSPRQIQVPKDEIKLLPFQEKALDSWLKAGKRGTIVVPTGGGKTFIALKALATVKAPTIILVITEELMNQWYERITRHLGIRTGRLGGGFNDVREVTVAIYNSAVNRIAEINDKFDLAIFDECLPYDSLVTTDRGLIPIGEVVEKRLPVRVLTHEGRFMRITNYFKIPLIKRLVKVTHEKGELVVTEDHLILTQDGWKPAIALRNGDVLYFHDAQVQGSREETSSAISPGRSLFNCPQYRTMETKIVETTPTSQGRESPVNKGGRGIDIITRINGEVEKDCSEDCVWELLPVNPTLKGEGRAAGCDAFFAPVRILNVETLTNTFRDISKEGEFVYDIEVEEDHSFVVDGVVVHNCHHVPADTFKEVAFKLRAPFRLALSATPERSDNNEHLIYLSAGDVVYQADYRDMVEAKLVVPVRHFRIYVDLTAEERRSYERTGDNAIVLRNIASMASAKIDIAREIVKAEAGIGSKIIVFTQFIKQAEEVYKVLKDELGSIVTLITSKTGDRDSIFRAFARGTYRVIVTTTVLDEGVDVPDADVAVILSGTGSQRQMIQRVGRVVRASNGKVEARVYEIVTRNTIEEALSEGRHVKGEVLEIECKRYLANEIKRLINHVIGSTQLFH